ncbi:MAG TPA: two-component sensor histidine kinase [Ktedonobacter sp.]|nr:two-component sensor histidine kinase [Ktedonobacter sp.]
MPGRGTACSVGGWAICCVYSGSEPRTRALAAAVVTLGQAEVWANAAIQPKPAAAVCELTLGLSLAWRRRFPLATITAVAVAASAEAVAQVPLQEPLVPLIAYVIAVYSLVTHASRERAFAGAIIALTGLAVQTASQHKGIGNFVFALVFVVGAWIAGRTIHARTARTEQLEREQQELALSAAEEERRRIARELHDIVSHSLGVLVLQAGAAEQVLERDPARAREVLRAIRATGQEAIGELGTLLAVARGEPEQSREPQPALADLDRLLATTREAGLQVELDIEGERRELPAAVELSAYRIVQEALTNVIRHAHAQSCHVRFLVEDALQIEVSDDGQGFVGSRSGWCRPHLDARARRGDLGEHSRSQKPVPCGAQITACLPLPNAVRFP